MQCVDFPQYFPLYRAARAPKKLRAVAMIRVIADHCDVTVFDHGYFGVDLFFVLSGFLITRLLVGDIDATGMIRKF